MRHFRLVAVLILVGTVWVVPTYAANAKPVSERELLCWIAADVPAFNIQYELRTRGVAFRLEQPWRDSLHRAGVNPEVLAVLRAHRTSAVAAPRDPFADRMLRILRETNSKKFAAAQIHLAALAKLDPSDPNLRIALGWVMGKQGAWGEAIPVLMEATTLDHDSIYAHEILSYASTRIGSINMAIKEARSAIDLRTGDPDAHKYLGLAYAARHEYDRAYAQYEEALKLRHGYAEIYADIGLILADEGQSQEAIDAYNRAIALDGSRWDFYYNLGNSLSIVHLNNEAIAAFKHAKDLAPDTLQVRENLGIAYCNAGRPQEAVSELHELLALDPNRNEARVCLYSSLEKLGRTEEADQVKADYEKQEKLASAKTE